MMRHNPPTNIPRQRRPAGPVVLIKGILDADNRVVLDEAAVQIRELLTRQPLGRVRLGVLSIAGGCGEGGGEA